jgi:hypothetical protein
MIECINENGGKTAGNGAAIGYADADQDISTYGNVLAVKYNGFKPRRVSIRNGEYDNFWSTQWLYVDPNEPGYTAKDAVVKSLMAYASDPDNIPTGKTLYWAAKNEMSYMKGTDQEYPGYTSPVERELP